MSRKISKAKRRYLLELTRARLLLSQRLSPDFKTREFGFTGLKLVIDPQLALANQCVALIDDKKNTCYLINPEIFQFQYVL